MAVAEMVVGVGRAEKQVRLLFTYSLARRRRSSGSELFLNLLPLYSTDLERKWPSRRNCRVSMASGLDGGWEIDKEADKLWYFTVDPWMRTRITPLVAAESQLLFHYHRPLSMSVPLRCLSIMSLSKNGRHSTLKPCLVGFRTACSNSSSSNRVIEHSLEKMSPGQV